MYYADCKAYEEHNCRTCGSCCKSWNEEDETRVDCENWHPARFSPSFHLPCEGYGEAERIDENCLRCKHR